MYRKLLFLLVCATLVKSGVAQHITNLYFFYQPDCKGCHKINEHVMPADSAGKYIDAHYNLIRINAAAEESWPLLEKYGIAQTPTFIFMDDSNVVLMKVVNSKFTAKSFVQKCEEVRQLGDLKKLYVSNAAKPAQVRELITIYERLSIGGDTTCFPIARRYFASQTEKQLNTPENRKLIYTLAAKHPLVVTLTSNAYQVLLDKKEIFYKEFDREQVDARICWVATLSNDLAILHKDSVAFRASFRVLEQYKNVSDVDVRDNDNATFVKFKMPPTMNRQLFYWINTDTLRFNNWEQGQLTKAWNNAAALSQLTAVLLEVFPGNTDAFANAHLLRAEAYIEKALTLDDSYDNNVTKAVVLNRLGLKEQAVATLQRGLSIGKANNLDVSKGAALLEELNKNTVPSK